MKNKNILGLSNEEIKLLRKNEKIVFQDKFFKYYFQFMNKYKLVLFANSTCHFIDTRNMGKLYYKLLKKIIDIIKKAGC